MKRKASALWQGTLKEGSGQLTTESSVLSNTRYSFHTRFENQVGTNPEELLAASHAGCFAMAFSSELQKMGFSPEKIISNATVSLDKIQDGWSITAVNLEVSARVPGINDSQFNKAAEAAKLSCLISKVLNTKIVLDAKLLPEEEEFKESA